MTLAELTNLLVVQIFGGNYLFFFFAIIIMVLAVMFVYRWTGAEAIIAVVLFSWAFFDSGINPLFTGIFAAVLLAVGIIFVIAIWRHFANG